MLTEENRIERLFCPHCGAGAYDATGEGDYECEAECRGQSGRTSISPLRERNLQGQEMIRLRLENEQLKLVIADLLRQADSRNP